MPTRLFDTVVIYDTPGTLNINVPAAQSAQINLSNIGNSVTVTFPATGRRGQCIGVNVYVQHGTQAAAVTLLGPVDRPSTLVANEDSVLYTWNETAAVWQLVAKHLGELDWSDAGTRAAAYVDANMLGRIGTQADIELQYQLVGVTPTRWAPLADPTMGVDRAHVSQNSSTTTLGLISMVVTQGTGTIRNQGITNALTRMERVAIVSAAPAGSTSMIRTNTNQGIAFTGGFRWRSQFGLATTSAACWWFAGFSDTIPGAAGADPVSLLNCLGVGRSAADANVQLFHNDGAGLATKVDLGANFLSTGVDLAFELELYSVSGADFRYQLTNLTSGAQISGIVNTELPKLTPNGGSPLYYLSNNVNAVALELCYGNQQSWARVA